MPVPGVEVRLVADDGSDVEASDDETIGEVAVRGPNLFTGYLNRPDATAEAMRDGWFFTGDLATRAPDGYWRIVGRRSTDLIKTGGYKVGAGEIEVALLEHPGVLEAAVTGAPDPDLGERIVAWVVAEGDAPGGARADRPRGRPSSRPTSARARSASSTSCPATRWARSSSSGSATEPLTASPARRTSATRSAGRSAPCSCPTASAA